MAGHCVVNLEEKNVTIIGTGALGSALAKALHSNGIATLSLFNRSSNSLLSLSAVVKVHITGCFPENIDALGDIIFITTPDQQITEAAEKLALITNDFSGKTIAHCSGTKTSDCLSVLEAKGGAVASFHPIQTFTKKSKADDFHGIYFDIEGNKASKGLLNKIAEILGAQAVEIDGKSKPYLHAAGVTASNYLLALLDTAGDIAEMGGIKKKQAQKMLMPLASKTLENARAENDISKALSGPIARGDTGTVADHIDLLKNSNDLQKLYKELGVRTVKLAEEKGTISQKEKDEFFKLFNRPEVR